VDEPPSHPDMPTLLRIVAWYEIVGGLLLLLSGILLLSRLGWLLILPGIVAAVAGWGLLKKRFWAYWTVVAISAINLVIASPLLSEGRSVALFSLIVNAVILLLLLTRRSLAWAQSLRAR
jgi:hypothetical protein